MGEKWYIIIKNCQKVDYIGIRQKKVNNGELYKIEKGIYSDEKFPSELSVIVKKYPKAISTLN